MGSTGGRLKASAIVDDERLVVAVEELTQTMGGLGTRLASTEAASTDTAQWRRKSTRWQRIAVGVICAAIATIVVTGIRSDAHERARNLKACRDRNGQAADGRSIHVGEFDILQGVGAPVTVIDPLRGLLAAAASKDRDCDSDGQLTSADYPPTIVTPATAPNTTAQRYAP